ncbi:transglutaminase-like domain-containing protein [Liberiplasma polymorphum]|uniref:transglutaminase-like domain-containing protein n=1 Tax=Liberiplasma polymorphum TaxID=3374570 RepID=UPI0037719CCC
MNKSKIKTGYGVFGKAYEYMFRNDLHNKHSVDHAILKNMVFLDEDSKSFLYKAPQPVSKDICNHVLSEIAHKLKGENHLESIYRTIEFVNGIVKKCDTPFEEMIFGGTELEIIKRGSDWCTDISRVGAALLQCLGMPSRIAILVNKFKAYHGHQIVEVYLDGTYMMCDFLYGVIARLDQNYSVHDLLNKPELVHKIYSSKIDDSMQLDNIASLYNLAAISEYDISKKNNYHISKPNEYYLKMMNLIQDGAWQMSEDISE